MSEKHSGLGVWWYFGNQLVELANIHEGARVLDVGCGWGTSLFLAAQKVGPLGHVTGIEIDEKDVEVMETSIKERGVTNASVLKMDAWQMTFDDASFDYVFGGSVIGFLLEEDTKQLCPEIYRVLKTDGVIGFSTWKTREDFDWMLEHLKREFPKVPESELSVYSRYSHDDLATILSNAGFRQITKHTVVAEFVYPDEGKWWKGMQLRTWKPFYEKIAARSPGRLEEFKETTYQELESLGHREGIRFRVSTIFVYGNRDEGSSD